MVPMTSTTRVSYLGYPITHPTALAQLGDIVWACLRKQKYVEGTDCRVFVKADGSSLLEVRVAAAEPGQGPQPLLELGMPMTGYPEDVFNKFIDQNGLRPFLNSATDSLIIGGPPDAAKPDTVLLQGKPLSPPSTAADQEGSIDNLAAILSSATGLSVQPDLVLNLVGDPVESNDAREQVISFLTGKLLSRGIRKGEAAALVERTRKSYEVQLLLRVHEGSELLGRVTVPLDGYRHTDFEKALGKAGITQTEDHSITVVVRRHTDSRRN